MWKYIVSAILVAAICRDRTADAQTMETHTNLQSVTAAGTSAWGGSLPFLIRGVILNDPATMLDPAYVTNAFDEGVMGGQWQLFIQAADSGDRGGTALWLGQNYNSIGPFIPEGNHYDEDTWTQELFRLTFDTNTLTRFQPGDLVEVYANQSLFYGGKRNVNEAHRIDPANNFYMSLVQAGYGLPEPEVIVLSNLVTSGTNQIFDQTRETGGERYQGARVRIDGLQMTTNYYGTNGWGQTAWADRLCTVTDGEGRFFNLRMPLADLGPVPNGWFSAVGILNQESGSGSDGTYGYELFVQEIGPELDQMAVNGRVLYAWSASFTNYVLEWSTNLVATSGWTRAESAPAQWIVVDEPLDNGDEARFYRLRKAE